MQHLNLEKLLSIYLSGSERISEKPIRLVRHVMRGWKGFDDLLRFDKDVLKIFTAEQGKSILDESEMVLAFVPYSGNAALLVGAYLNKGPIAKKEWEQSDGYEKYAEFRKSSVRPVRSNAKNFYELQNYEELQELCGRLVVDWPGARTFVQKKLDKSVVQILPPGFVSEFPGWDNVRITFQELVAITENPEGNKDWYNFLSSHDGVYLIMDEATGGLYVGSATGFKGGVWGRWKGYAKTRHNNNEHLKKLILAKGEVHAMNFVFSLHHVFARGSTSKAETLRLEQLLIRKLGSRAHGLN